VRKTSAVPIHLICLHGIPVLPDNLVSFFFHGCRSWFQEHAVSILLGILLAILVTLSAFLVVLVWRKKFSGQTAYRPVDSVVPEQELQPL
jgi:hypothetical protein